MLTGMRTTLVIDDHVFTEAKRHAVDVGLSLSELTTLALRDTLRKRDQIHHEPPYTMPTYGAGSTRDSSTEALADLRDDGR